jgi:hypothetical protein
MVFISATLPFACGAYHGGKALKNARYPNGDTENIFWLSDRAAIP